MIVAVTDATVELREPADLRRFHVEAADGVDVTEVLAAAGAGAPAAGEADGGAVYVAVDWLRSAAAEHGVAADWPDQFAAMLDFAASKGWLRADGSAVRAHVERV